MPQLRPARTISVSIAAPAAEVYAFVADPRRLPKWATGLGSTPTPLSDGAWRVETPAGPMRVVFAPPNDFGVVDHVVSALMGGDPVADFPLRVVSNGNGSEVMLTVFQQPGMSNAQFASDTALVQADLERLKHAVEHEPR
jgi:carbon monoxide dehydrogenase subunit G